MIKGINMSAALGNQYAKKLTTPELCQLAYDSYCEHLAKGKDKKSWNLKTPVTLTWETMEKYIRENPQVFDPIKKAIAESDGFGVWEQVVEDVARGKNKDANVAAIQMKMRCKFGWDRADRRDDDTMGSAQFNQERLLEQIHSRQMIAMHTVTQAVDTSNHTLPQSDS